MTLQDWRGLPTAALAPLFGREQRRWLAELHWDVAGAHAQIELARTTWGLPGLVAIDAAGEIAGLVFYIETAERLEIGGILAGTPAVTGALLTAVIDIADTAGMPVFCFSCTHTAGLTAELARLGFDIDPLVYFERSLTGRSSPGLLREPRPASRAWRMDDLDETAALLHRSFDETEAAHFAPGHTRAAWQHYVHNLVHFEACGTINPGASRCVPLGDGLGALTLVTTIAATTAHIVQVAVDPACRGSRLATALLQESCDAAWEQGCTTMTLMAAARNATASRIYAELGFSQRAAFVAATRAPQPVAAILAG
jgi:ribosomal protein S18 acetylase RimI-like enzyme